MIDDDERERIRAYLNATSKVPVKPARIRAITVNPSYRWMSMLRIEVGGRYRDFEPGAPAEEVLAIFESASFIVCTKTRGAGSGAPYYFSREDVRRVEYEPPSDQADS